MIWYDTNEVVTIEIGFVRSNTLYPEFEDGDRVPDDHEVRLPVSYTHLTLPTILLV